MSEMLHNFHFRYYVEHDQAKKMLQQAAYLIPWANEAGLKAQRHDAMSA